VFGKATEKIAAALVMLAHEYGDTEGSGVKIQFPLPHRILASFVGMTRETVSLGMQELTKRNYIHSRGQRVTVLDLDSLREWIENGS
jgi:CRP-like cAMP-binding protein